MPLTAAVASPAAVLRRQAALFKALGHPARLTMVQALAEGERCVCELNALVRLDMSTVSKHLTVLKAVGLVADEKRANKVFYRLTMPCVLRFCACIAEADRDGI